jgi:hypothetical protein
MMLGLVGVVKWKGLVRNSPTLCTMRIIHEWYTLVIACWMEVHTRKGSALISILVRISKISTELRISTVLVKSREKTIVGNHHVRGVGIELPGTVGCILGIGSTNHKGEKLVKLLLVRTRNGGDGWFRPDLVPDSGDGVFDRRGIRCTFEGDDISNNGN